MHLFHITQCSIQKRNVHISVLNGALWDVEQVHSGICEIGLLVQDAEVVHVRSTSGFLSSAILHNPQLELRISVYKQWWST